MIGLQDFCLLRSNLFAKAQYLSELEKIFCALTIEPQNHSKWRLWTFGLKAGHAVKLNMQ